MMKLSAWLLLAAFAGLMLFGSTGCKVTDDARVLQLLNERGFGRAASGNCNETFYFGIGDSIKMKDKFNPELKGLYKIRMDGTVDFPQIGETYVAGFTAKELASMLNMRYGHYYKYVAVTIEPTRITSKKYFVHLDTDKSYMKPFKGGQTLYDILMTIRYNSIDVDLSNVKVIRSDPVHPLVIYCDMDAMINDGDSRDNILIKEDDIIYMTPSLIGYFKRFVKMLVSPLQPLTNLVNSVNRIDILMDTFGDPYYNQRYGRGRNYYR